MKKISVVVFISLSIFCIFGCASFLSSTERLAMSSLYSISNETREDIRGNLDVSRLLISKQITMSSNEVVTIDKFMQNGLTLYTITVQYLGPDWRFMDEILLRIDNNLLTLKDSSPGRTVNRSSNVTVTEIVRCFLTDDVVESMRNCSSLTLQYFRNPINIPVEGINAIKQFLEKE